MLKSKQIRESIAKAGEAIGQYRMDGNTILASDIKMCRIFEKFATFNFDTESPTVINDLRCFMEGVNVPTYPIPATLFSYETEQILINDEIAGRAWTSLVNNLELQTLTNKDKLPLLESIVTGYFNLYGTQNLQAPQLSQQYFRNFDIAEIAKKSLISRQARHDLNFKSYLDKWKLHEGLPVLKNRTGREYIRFNKDTGKLETTLGVMVSPADMLKFLESYTAGKKEIVIKGHLFAKDEYNKDTFVEFTLPASVQDSGDVVVNCVTISKDEILNAAKMLP